MSWWLPHNFEQKVDNLMVRSQVIKALRRYFDERSFIEVDTPALQVCPVMDAHIGAFQTVYKPVDKSGDKALYLQTSPEFDMKKLLAAGMKEIYQIAHVYRNGETTLRHSPEFSLLEWYRVGVDYHTLMDDCDALLRHVAVALEVQEFRYGHKFCDPLQVCQRLSVVDAFDHFTKIDLGSVLNDLPAFAAVAQNIGVRVTENDAWDDIFHAVMAEKIEPYLGVECGTILYDYPVSMAALSRPKPADPRFAERFELYVCGVELANAFSELTDADEQRKRYSEEMALKKELYGEVYPPDEEFFKALDFGLPECSGIALGVDRLVMLVCGAPDIRDVQWAQCPV
jgi:lysyl-tRNA synthetase class 2